MITKKQLRAENEKLKQEIATFRILLRAYMTSNHKYQDDIEVLNQSLDIANENAERWAKIAHKADEIRRAEYIARRKEAMLNELGNTDT